MTKTAKNANSYHYRCVSLAYLKLTKTREDGKDCRLWKKTYRANIDRIPHDDISITALWIVFACLFDSWQFPIWLSTIPCFQKFYLGNEWVKSFLLLVSSFSLVFASTFKAAVYFLHHSMWEYMNKISFWPTRYIHPASLKKNISFRLFSSQFPTSV